MNRGRLWARIGGAALVAVAVAGLAGPASATTAAVVVAGPYAAVTGFSPADVIVTEGDALTLVSADVQMHRIEATQYTGALPLFASANAGIGSRVKVEGVEFLSPGTYAYVCPLHSTTMRGTITIVAEPNA